MEEIKFDFNNFFSFNIGNTNGVTDDDLKETSVAINSAQLHLKKLFLNKDARLLLSLEWAELPFQDNETVQFIQKLGSHISKKYENVLFLGIGGSYLGLKAAQDALAGPYHNEFALTKKNCPRIYFEGNNLDPDTLAVLIKNLNPRKTFLVVISKSGETTETKAAFEIAESWLRKGAGKHYGRQIIAITDPESGSLRKRVNIEQAKDKLSFRSLPLLKGVGGRFSELNMGLLHLAVIGVKISDVLKGALDMHKRCSRNELFRNPACMYAALQYILYRKKGKPISILMPFSETLKSTADWYIQLLAESLGKKYSRRIEFSQGTDEEIWGINRDSTVNVGRTPISSRGTLDLHSIQQNNIEGENNKTITFIKVNKFKTDLKVPQKVGLSSGRHYSELMALALESTEWALVREQRPNCTIIMPEASPYYWGGLIFFFQMATAFEGELLNINAFNQPGVEGYKNYMYYKLNKPGIPQDIIEEINKNPLKKEQRFII